MIQDIAELRALIPHMGAAEREELREALFGFDLGSGLANLAFHELNRLEHLADKVMAAWPYLGGQFTSASLLELLVALSDEEARDYLILFHLIRGGQRPADHPLVAATYLARKAASEKWPPDGPLFQ
jgi:hypothetical protein